jgi:hypothetical protein
MDDDDRRGRSARRRRHRRPAGLAAGHLPGNVCALLAAKDHVNVFLYDGAVVPDPEGIITGGHDNSTARTIAVRRGERINAPALTAMLKQIIADNRAGGWRKIKRDRERRDPTPP